MADDLKSQTRNEKEMNVTDHLSELRNRIIVTAVFFVLFFAIGIFYVKAIYGFFAKDLDFTLTITAFSDIISVYITMASLVAIAGTLPILGLQLWLFIRPGLTKKERKLTLAYIPAIFLLFIGGMAFGYVIFINMIMPFLLSLNEGMFNELFTYDKYFKFLFRIIIPFALLFEMPIIAMFLTSLGLITPDFMKKTRKYAYFVLIIVGTIITPPDFVLQLVAAIPLLALYEVSLQLSKLVYRKKLKKHQEYMATDSF